MCHYVLNILNYPSIYINTSRTIFFQKNTVDFTISRQKRKNDNSTYMPHLQTLMLNFILLTL